MNTGMKFVWPLVAALALAGGSYFGTAEFNRNSLRADTTAQTAKPTPEPKMEAIAPANELSRAFRSVHQSMKDAVVNIHVVKKMAMGGRGLRPGQLPEGFELPKGFSLPKGFQFHDVPQEGTGSGVIVSPDGYILTNNHVVDGATEIMVTLNDGRDLKAKVIGTDPKTDLAVVKVTADHLTYARFGDSEALEVGDWVLAFGSPFGFEQTMTQGIISAKGRQIHIIEGHNSALRGLTYENFLQTDAAINPGNSGGPLVNLKGEVVGINAAIASSSGNYNGIGFSIPSNDAQYIMNSLIKNGSVVRGYLSVQIEDINHADPLADSIRKEGFKGTGALVEKLDPEGPAGKGGVKAGDVITAIEGKPVETVDRLRNQIARTAPGTKIGLSVYREGKALELSFPVGTQPAENPMFARTSGDVPTATMDNEALGVSVKGLDKETAKKYRMEGGNGVVVTEVAPGGMAEDLGIAVGDVITQVGKTEVASAEQFGEVLGKTKLSEGVRLSIRSADGMERTVLVQKQ